MRYLRDLPSREYLRREFEYIDDEEAVVNGYLMRGALIRRSRRRKLIFGSLTERATSRATVGIKGLGVHYLHRVVWVMNRGPVPAGRLVDHEDNDRGHNRIENLRALTDAENQMNRRRSRSGATVVFIGVCANRDAFSAFVSEGSRPIYLGRFTSATEAAMVRDEEAARRYPGVARLNRDLFPELMGA